jgi:putative serine protease PepD
MRPLAAIALAALALAGCSGSDGEEGPSARPAAQTSTGSTRGSTSSGPAATTSEAPTLTQSSQPPPASELADMIAGVLPSVVNVSVSSIQGEGTGSGVVVDAAGTILTNFHVVQGATSVTLRFNDGEHEELEGEVVGTAPERDLAVIRVAADDLIPIELGDSSGLRLGDGVVALGFPLGIEGGPTVTSGIVSGLDRTIAPEGGPQLEGLLQTDAAINPGNSGGALVDLNGRLVGINTAAASAGYAENVGFAIAIDTAMPVAREILDEPPEERAWLGVSIGSDARGAVLAAVVPGSPADEAGLEPGDVIVSLDGEEIASAEDLVQRLTELDPGDTVELELADGRTVEAELEQRPATLPP